MLISIHTFLAEGDKIISMLRSASIYFNPHLPRGRWRYHTGQNPDAGAISIHTFLAEGDRFALYCNSAVKNFNPHLPRGRWPWSAWCYWRVRDFNPHLPRGRWRDGSGKPPGAYKHFNPHLPRGRWRASIFLTSLLLSNFNPHLPRGRWRCSMCWEMDSNWFQSTPSSRKVTGKRQGNWSINLISIHTFLAEGDQRDIPWFSTANISIHTFLAEGDYTSLRS